MALLKCQCACESPGELLKHASSLSNQISFPQLPLHITKTWQPKTTHTYYSTVLMAKMSKVSVDLVELIKPISSAKTLTPNKITSAL